MHLACRKQIMAWIQPVSFVWAAVFFLGSVSVAVAKNQNRAVDVDVAAGDQTMHERVPETRSILKDEVRALSALLSEDEIADEGIVRKLLEDPRLEISENIVIKNLATRGIGTHYLNCDNTSAIRKSKAYLKTHRTSLKKAAEKFDVPESLIVAILWMESALGTWQPKHAPHVLNVYVSLYLETFPEHLAKYRPFMKRAFPHLTDEKMAQRMKQKQAWALTEMKALLRAGQRENLDLLAIKGSYAGAWGLPQFIPSSYNQFGVDGNGDGKVRLYHRADAFASIANYFAKSGWKTVSPESERKKVIYKYNHSDDYVDCVTRIMEKLK